MSAIPKPVNFSHAQSPSDGKYEQMESGAVPGEQKNQAFRTAVVRPWHRLGCRAYLNVLTPQFTVLGGLAAYGIAAYNSTQDHGDLQYLVEDPGSHAMAAAAGAVIGALVPSAVGLVQHACRSVKERCVVMCKQDEPVERIISQALDAAPLTFKGLERQVQRLKEACRNDSSKLAKSIAALGKAISLEDEGCCEAGSSTKQLIFLQLELQSLKTGEGALPVGEYHRALLKLADNLVPEKALSFDEAKEFAVLFLQAAEATGGEPSIRKTWDLLDFASQLFPREIFRGFDIDTLKAEAAAQLNGLKDISIQGAMPRSPDRADSKASKLLFDGNGFLNAIGDGKRVVMTCETLYSGLTLLSDKENVGLARQSRNHLLERLKPQDDDSAALARAKSRASVIVWNWGGTFEVGDEPGSDLGLDREGEGESAAPRGPTVRPTDWTDATCLEREALGVIVRRDDYKGAELRPLSEQVQRRDALAKQLTSTPLDKLHAEVGYALGIALRPGRVATEQARDLLSIFEALGSRTDIVGGMFQPGLLSPQKVNELSDAIAEQTDRPFKHRTGLMAQLPRLCQYQYGSALVTSINEKIRQITPPRLIPDKVITTGRRIGHSGLISMRVGSSGQPTASQPQQGAVAQKNPAGPSDSTQKMSVVDPSVSLVIEDFGQKPGALESSRPMLAESKSLSGGEVVPQDEMERIEEGEVELVKVTVHPSANSGAPLSSLSQ